MKILTVGRSDECDIIIEDDQNMISRRHAILRFYPWGKIEIVPQGQNGTYVNGFPIRNGVPKTIKRNDVISFAHARQLDWRMVNDPYRTIRYGVIALLSILIIGVLYQIGDSHDWWMNQTDNQSSLPVSNNVVQEPDSLNKQEKENPPKVEEKASEAESESKKEDTTKNKTSNSTQDNNKHKPGKKPEPVKESSDQIIQSF